MTPADSNLFFSISLMQVKDGKALRALEPNENGVYENIPLAVIGVPSRNRVMYSPQSVVKAITDPNTMFYKKLIEGGLTGEYGHPYLKDMSDLRRVVHIDETRVSHLFTKIESKQTDSNEFIVIFGDVLPTGPYGQYLDKSFRNPLENTAFSLRSLTSKPIVKNGVQYKDVIALITFDYVSGPGYEQASKRFVPATESYDIPLDIKQVISDIEICDVLGIESNNLDQLYDILKTDKITINNMNVIVDSKTKTIYDVNHNKKSLFFEMFN